MNKKSKLSISYDYENPYIIFDIAIRDQIFNYFLDFFEEIFQDFFIFGEKDEYLKKLYLDDTDKTNDIQRFLDRMNVNNEEYYEFIKNYIEKCHTELAEFINLDDELKDGYNRITQIIINDSERILTSYDPSFDSSKLLEHYRVNYKLEKYIVDDNLLLLLPFYYIVYTSYQYRQRDIEQIHDLIFKELKEDDPISMHKLHKNLISENVLINLDFLKFICLNEENILTLFNQTKVDLIEEIIPSAKVLALNIDPSRFYKISNYSLRAGFENLSMKITTIDNEFLAKYLKSTNNDRFIEGISFNELICKLRTIRRVGETLHQGIPETTYNAIITLLNDKKSNLTYSQICEYLFIDEIESLSPKKLPPGRLLAYGLPNVKRYIQKSTATYTLLDWVETKSKKKGMILKNRILTPIQIDNITIDEYEVMKIINNDKYYNKFGIINSINVYKVYQLNNNYKKNIYYDSQSINIIEEILDEKEILHFIGKGFYIHDHFLKIKRNDMTTSKWRKMIAQSLEQEFNLEEQDFNFLDLLKL